MTTVTERTDVPAAGDAAPRPYYLTGPCPAWCIESHYGTDWAYDDRTHRSCDYDVTLTAMDAHHWIAEGELSTEPRVVSGCLWQHYREAEPQVWLSHGDDTQETVSLTLAEAEQVARDILEMVRLARESR